MITITALSVDEYDAIVNGAFAGEQLSGRSPLLVVDALPQDLVSPGGLPVIVCVLGAQTGGTGPAGADLVVDGSDLDSLVEVVLRNPLAATSLAVLLRQSERSSVEHALAAESAVYSMLQGGTEFARWRAGGTPQVDQSNEPAVLLDRVDDVVTITLNRPHRHNAVSRALRDELCAALEVGRLDDTVDEIHLRGTGPSFCSGGDLAEFGARSDPATAHVIRLAQSPARLLHAVHARTTAFVHGATLGGGIEMAAFADRVVADPQTRVGLPEVSIGLIPGAGGTVSIPRRIGRQRTLALALAVDTIDAATALAWGLVDDVRRVAQSGGGAT